MTNIRMFTNNVICHNTFISTWLYILLLIMGTNFQIMCVNVDGLGIHRKSKLRRHATPPIIKELISNAKNKYLTRI